MNDTRERILDALQAVVAQEGPSGATLDAVAARAGVSKGGLLYHFGTKEALFTGLLDRLRRLAEEDVAAWRASRRGIVPAYVDASMVAQGEYTSALLAALRLVGTPGVGVEDAILETFGLWFDELAAQVDDPVLARLVHLVGDGLYLHALVGAEPHELDHQVAERLVELAVSSRT